MVVVRQGSNTLTWKVTYVLGVSCWMTSESAASVNETEVPLSKAFVVSTEIEGVVESTVTP